MIYTAGLQNVLLKVKNIKKEIQKSLIELEMDLPGDSGYNQRRFSETRNTSKFKN